MIKARNKKISLLLALVFAFTVIFPVGSVFAAGEPAVSYTTTTVTGGESAQSLGYIKIDGDDMSTAGAVYLEITLPDGVTLDAYDEEEETFDEASVAAMFKNYTATEIDADEDEISVVIVPDGDDADLYIAFEDAVTVAKSADDDIMVEVDAKATSIYGGTAWELLKEFKLATKATGDITATAGTPKSIKYGDEKEVAKITVKEAYAGQFKNETETRDADTITLELPSDDYAFTDVTVTGKYGLEAIGDTAAIDADGESAVITIDTQSTQFAGQLEIKAEITVYPNAPEGDIEIDVTSSNKNFDDASLVVAVVGDSDVTVEADEDTGMEDYMRMLSINELWELTFETSGTFAAGDDIYITLPDGFEFNNDADLDNPYVGVPDMNDRDEDFGGNVVNRGLYNGKQSIWLKVGDAANDETEFTISGLYVAALPDAEYGDIEIEISGDVVETSVVAGYVKPAVTIEADKAAVEVGLAEAAGDIVFTETDKDALGNITIFAKLPSGVEFASTPTVFVNDDEISSVDVDGRVLEMTLSKMSNSRIDTITITDIEYAIDNRYDDGDEIALSIGGVDVDDQINNLPYVDGTNEQFEDEYDDALVKVVNAVVGDKDIVTATFTVGDEGVAIMNGRTLVQVNMLTDVLGLQKSWDAASKTAYFVKDGKVVAFPMGENAIYINGVKLPVDQGGVIINDYTYATLRGVQAAFGGELSWDDATKTATFKF